MPKPLMIAAVLVLAVSAGDLLAQEPGWASNVVLPANMQRRVDSMPILRRPYRPLHLYGNTVRRLHYRNRVLPATSDFRHTGQHLLRRTYTPVQTYVR